MKTTCHYGVWKSPITPEMAASSAIQFQDLKVDDEDVYWLEKRPQEAGRVALMRYSPQVGIHECLPKQYSVRTRVQEYGGSAFTVHQGILYFVNESDQRIYRQAHNAEPQALTISGIRYADLQYASYGLIAVAEEHTGEKEPNNYLALIDHQSGHQTVLAQGHDFYAFPALSQDESQLAFIAWDHPNMPWDNTSLWVGTFSVEGLHNVRQIDASFLSQSFFQPQWRKDNQLFVVSDKSNWWSLYRVVDNSLEPSIVHESEMGQPLWVFGLSKWAYFQEGIVFSRILPEGYQQLIYHVDGSETIMTLPFTGFSYLRASESKIVCIATSPDKPAALIEVEQTGQWRVIYQSTALMSLENISIPRAVAFESDNNRKAYGYFYPPTNVNYEAPKGAQPPLLVLCHGGPTSQATDEWDMGIQYWTTRGFAVVNVNYAGSTGWGRTFRHSLYGHWGEYDVQDCIAAARFCIDKGWVDPFKIAMIGGSAGGFTALTALAQSSLFQAGCIRYGVTDIATLLHDTHKFEAHYITSLVGPEVTSPIDVVDKIQVPVLFFHGDKDKVVPLSQAQTMVTKLQDKGTLTKLIVFEGEQHGFKQATTRATLLKEQHLFLLESFKINHE